MSSRRVGSEDVVEQTMAIKDVKRIDDHCRLGSPILAVLRSSGKHQV